MNASFLTSQLDFLPDRSDEVVSSSIETNLSFLDIAGRFSQAPGTVALMSGGNADCARYNILGINPWLTLRANLTHATIAAPDHTATITADPFDLMHHIIRYYGLSGDTSPLPICSGLFGYLSYDLKDCIEALPRTCIDDLHLPHLYMVAPSVILVEDRNDKRKTLHVSTIAGDAALRKASFEQALAAPEPTLPELPATLSAKTSSCFSRSEYMQAIDTIHDYIVRGDVYQVNMSQRFETAFNGDPFRLFTSLFACNPAPFFAYINAGNHHIVSTSPERFMEVRGKKVETRPIKGTRPRGRNPVDDLAYRNDLLNSPKDDAELTMIVDLMRNDIGKVCLAASVTVREHKRIEAYENVFHLISIVDGVLADDKDAVDLVRAAFPGGSITGCPKIRSMEIIDELEPVRRHIYTGSIGYFGFNGDMDLSIAIRTATVKDGRAVFSVGGGIVCDSDAADEYEETLHKGRTLLDAFGDALIDKRQDSPVAWYNGKLLPLHECAIPASNEGFLYGYGIFETIRVHNGMPCNLPQHLDRFNRSWQALFCTEPPDVTWNAVIAQVVDRCGLSAGVAAVKLLAAAGNPEKPGTMTLLVTARRYVHRLQTVERDGLYLTVYPHRRYSHLASHKTMNYMFCKIANDRAKKQGADEAVILNFDGSVCETATANILCIINGKWYRPASEHVLPGIMLQAVCTLLGQRGTPVETRVVSVDELKKADRVFLTNALMGIVPVLRIDETPIGGDTTGLCADINLQVLG